MAHAKAANVSAPKKADKDKTLSPQEKAKAKKLTLEVIAIRRHTKALKKLDEKNTSELKQMLTRAPLDKDGRHHLAWEECESYISGGNEPSEPFALNAKAFAQGVADGIPEYISVWEACKVAKGVTPIAVNAKYTKAEEDRQKTGHSIDDRECDFISE